MTGGGHEHRRRVRGNGDTGQKHVGAPRKRQRKPSADAGAQRRPFAASKWQRHDSSVASVEAITFPLQATRRDRALNRKKLSHTQKQRLKQQQQQHASNGFVRGTKQPSPLSLDLSAGLETDLTTFAQFLRLTPEERAFRAQVFAEISELITAAFPSAVVELYGSSSSGLETFRSDLDITVGGLDATPQRRVATPASVYEQDATSDSDSSDLSEDEGAPTFSLNLTLSGANSNRHQPHQPPTMTSRGKPQWAASAPTKSPWNPTLRRHKMRQLRALQQLLAIHRPQFKVKCLAKAKVPILLIEDPSTGLGIDLGVNREAFSSSDHGRTTALVTLLQRSLGAPFVSIVLFLKEFLHQFGLDKPFTGGLGSYRLYMMVAYVFGSSPALGNSPSRVLLRFLELFGNCHKRVFLSATTELPVRCGPHVDVVDFAAVFRLSECVDKFAMAWEIIHEQGNLGCVVYEDKLTQERSESMDRVRRYVASQQQQQHQQSESESESDASDASSLYEDER